MNKFKTRDEELPKVLEGKWGDISLEEQMYTKAGVEARLGDISTTVSQYIAEKISVAYKAGGSKAAAEFTSALLVEANEGMVYNLTDKLTIDSAKANLFVDAAAGKEFAPGTNIVVVNTSSDDPAVYKFDVLAPTDATLVKSVNGIIPNASGEVTIPDATTSESGLMSAEDKAALDEHVANSVIHVTAENKAAWNAKYDKPAAGIPSTDMTAEVQASLALADTAIQNVDGKANKSEMSVTVEGDKTTIQLKEGTSATVINAHQDISGKVDKVEGKQLSTEDYTTAEKTKLAGIAEGAQVNVIESVKVDGSALTVTEKAVNIDLATPLAGKVDKVDGKGLSTNDYTTEEKNKLAGIAEGAEVNQNAFSNVKVGADTVAASGKTDTFELVAGENVTLTADSTTKKITIKAATSKADKVANATAGNFAGLDSTGNLTDSGVKAADFKTKQSAVSDPTAQGTGVEFIATLTQDANGVVTATKKTVQGASASAAGLESAAHFSKVEGIEEGAQVNVIETVKVNGTSLTPDSNKAVDVIVPTKTSDITNDSDFITSAAIADMAKKSEMSVTPGSGEDADKTTIQLQSGISAKVLTTHQDISGKAEKTEVQAVDTKVGAINAAAAALLTAVGTDAPTMTTANEIKAAVTALYAAIKAFAQAADNA